MTGPVFGVPADRTAGQLKVMVALVQGSPMAVAAAVTAWAVILQEGAA
jgi:hypothetical protein